MHVGGLHGHDKKPIFFQKPIAFDYGIDGLCGGGAWVQVNWRTIPSNQANNAPLY
jgi:hypothetical protein